MSKGARETTRRVTFLEQALAELALKQHGTFCLAQLRELGLTASAVRRRCAAGRLHRIHHAVYSLVPRELLKRDGLYMAAVLACGPGAVLSHRSAAALHQLRDWGHTKIEVTLPSRSSRKHAGIKVHCSTTLTDADVTVVNNIPVTTVSRTLLDLGEVVPRRRLERSFDQAEILEALDLRALQDQLARNPTRRGAKEMRGVLATHYIGSTPTDNDFEEGFLALTRSLGLPDPRAQFYIDPGDGEPPIKVDFAWPDRRIAVETDSVKWHHTRQRFEIDRRRDQRLTAAGWTVIRTTSQQMKHRPHELRAVLLKLLGPGSPNARRSPAVAGAPAPGRPRTRPVGGSTS